MLTIKRSMSFPFLISSSYDQRLDLKVADVTSRVKGLVHPKVKILSLITCHSKPIRPLVIFKTYIIFNEIQGLSDPA